ncbi:MAG TPA: amylo-alpha-1,6-glucosidase [Pyrinomonadaceae bacterium]|nr:amylo-alpha-1,6-glucosidase [Pyrinomonadaceae bacterium]
MTSDTIKSIQASTSLEWLETNGLGGFSSSTVIGLNTRRYHGLLTAATRPPVGRIVLLSKLEETLVIEGNRYELSANQYSGVIHPQGFFYQIGFRLDPFPVFTYEVEGWRLEKSVFMVQGQNTVVATYELKRHADGGVPGSLKLEIRPLIAFRDYHSTTHENTALNSHVTTEDGITVITPYNDLPSLYFAHDEGEIDPRGYWYRNFHYTLEQERGLDFTEDLFNPFCLTFDLDRYARPRIMASTEPRDVRGAEHHLATERGRREHLQTMARAVGENELVRALTVAADQFIVARGSQKTVIAGYHWFSDWGRDTMIALPGLTLTTGRPELARSILGEFAAHVDRGMVPNRFPDAGETPEYNTVDATLWFFEATRALLQYTGDYEFVREKLYDVLIEIIDWHVKGTRYNIHVDADGLLLSGEPGVQLTWMDAKVGDWVVTPRQGKPVEIQALWYNALRVMEQLADKFKNTKLQTKYGAMADCARDSFNALFWNEAKGCLYDVIDGDIRDGSVRPNQIIAISLENSMVSQDRAEKILRVVERELLTPRGLRTLSPQDPKYHGRYEGSPSSRDSVYHQGTVWPWLMGPYITACVKTFGGEVGRKAAAVWLRDFQQHLREAGLGQVSEIFDGDAPYTPRGCIAQAWSVAELLRAAVEDVYTTESSVRAAKAT